VANHAINTRRGIDLAAPIRIGQCARLNLPGSRLFPPCGGGKSKYAARANSQHPADDSLIPHTQTDHVSHIPAALEKMHHHHVVSERLCRTHDLDEFRLVRPDALEDAIQVL